MNTFALGIDTAWALVALGALALAALALPFLLRRGGEIHSLRSTVVGVRLASVTAASSRTAAWAGFGFALLVAAAPGSMEERLTRSAAVIAAIVLALAVAWRAVYLVRMEVSRPRETRLGSAHAAGPLISGTGLAAAALMIIALIVAKGGDCGLLLVLMSAGFAVAAIALRSAAALAGLAHAGASLDVAALESERQRGSAKDPGLELAILAALVAHGPRKAVEAAALVSLLAGVSVLIGVPIFGLSAITTAIILCAALLLATIMTAVAPVRMGDPLSHLRSRFILSLTSGIFPLVIAASSLALWIPSGYSDLRMRVVGLGDFTDPLLLSLFVDQTSQSVPESIPRDQVESLIVQMGENWDQLYETVGDAPAAQSVVDTIMLHMLNPALLTALALAVGGVWALALVWGMHRVGGGGSRLDHTHALSARVSWAALSFSGARTGAVVSVLAVLGIGGLWTLITAAAGIAYVGFYLIALASFAMAIIWAGMGGASGAELATLNMEEFDLVADSLPEPSPVKGAAQSPEQSAGEEKNTSSARHTDEPVAQAATVADTQRSEGSTISLTDLFGNEDTQHDSHEHTEAEHTEAEHKPNKRELKRGKSKKAKAKTSLARSAPKASRARDYGKLRTHAPLSLPECIERSLPDAITLDSLFSTLVPALAVISLIAPVGGEARAAAKQLELWADRSLRVQYLDSPTVVLGVLLGALICALAYLLSSDTARRVLAGSVIEARVELAEETKKQRARVRMEPLESAIRRQSAVVFMVAVMGPVISGFGLGVASLVGYLLGAVATGVFASAAALVQLLVARQAVGNIEQGSCGGTGSLAHQNALISLSHAGARSSMAQVIGDSPAGFASLTALSTLAVAPLIVQLATDGTNPLVRAIFVVAAAGLIITAYMLARSVEEPDLDDEQVPEQPLFER